MRIVGVLCLALWFELTVRKVAAVPVDLEVKFCLQYPPSFHPSLHFLQLGHLQFALCNDCAVVQQGQLSNLKLVIQAQKDVHGV